MPFQIIRNDITKVRADAVVNTANPEPVYASGTDSAIYRAAGAEELLAERRKIGHIGTGEVAVTPAFRLQAKYIIHTVGPAWIDGMHREYELLASCYRKSLLIARQLGCRSIAFPLISTGVYGFPKDKALDIALAQISAFLEEMQSADEDMEVTLVVFDKRAFDLSAALVRDVGEYIDENYVKERREQEYGRDYAEEERERRARRVHPEAEAQRRDMRDGSEKERRRPFRLNLPFGRRGSETGQGTLAGSRPPEQAGNRPAASDRPAADLPFSAAFPDAADIPSSADIPSAAPFPDVSDMSAQGSLSSAEDAYPEDVSFEASFEAAESVAAEKPASYAVQSGRETLPDSKSESVAGTHFYEGAQAKGAAKSAAGKKPRRSAPQPRPRSLQDVMSHVGESFQECLLRIIDEKGLSDTQVYKRANIDRKLFSKIRCNANYNPTRRTAISLAIALELNRDEMTDLLRKAGIALSPGNKFDLIISYCVENGIYDMYRINAILFEYDQPLLGA